MEQKQENQFFGYSGTVLLGLLVLTFFSSYAKTGSNCAFLNTLSSNLLTVLGFISMAAICYFCLRKSLRQNSQMKPFVWQPKLQTYEKILIALLAFFGGSFIGNVLGIFSLTEWNIFHANENTPALGTMAFFGAVIFTALYAAIEEIIFRGILLRSQIHNGLGFALVSSSILFVCMHSTKLIALFFIAIVFGGVYILTGSIIYPIAIHAINNIYEFLIAIYIAPFFTESTLRFILFVVFGVLSVVFLTFCFCSKNIRFLLKQITWKNIKMHFSSNKKLYIELLNAPGTIALFIFLFINKGLQLMGML